MSILAHLVTRIGDVEPVATQALAFLLRNAESASVFVRLLDLIAPDFADDVLPVSIRAEQHYEDGRPDLTVRDAEGRVRILVENKFWAGLTDRQPVAYLNLLHNQVPSALLFVVPQQRTRSLWHELKRRCRNDEILLHNEGHAEGVRGICTVAGPRILAITSWTKVLDTLDQAAVGDPAHRQDIAQLSGLIERMDIDAFLPLREGEVTAQDVARRMVNYGDLIPDIVAALVAEDIASIEGCGYSHNYHWSGRYLRLHRRFGLWLGVHRNYWNQWGITPIWSEHSDDANWSGIDTLQEAKGFFEGAQIRDNHLCIPIRLPTGVDRCHVIDDAVNQLEAIGEQLREAFPE